jgi:hypothetical protein
VSQKDEKECSYMLQCIIDDGVPYAYVEVVHKNSKQVDESDSEYQLEEQ